MRLAIKNARIVDPATGRDGTGDLYVADGKISAETGRADRTIDAKGLVAAPGFIDIAARLREPGFEYNRRWQRRSPAVSPASPARRTPIRRSTSQAWSTCCAGAPRPCRACAFIRSAR